MLKLLSQGLCTGGFWSGAGRSPEYREGPARAIEPFQESNVQIPPASLPLQEPVAARPCSSDRAAPDCTTGVRGFICQLSPKRPQDWGGSTPRVPHGIQKQDWGCHLHQLELRQALGSMGSGGGMKALLASRLVQASVLQGQVNCGFFTLTASPPPLLRNRARAARPHWPQCQRRPRCWRRP